MSKRYVIWDKVSPVFTPSGEMFTAEEWMDRYPIARLDSVTIIGSAGDFNGSIFATLSQMKEMCEKQGCDFSACTTDQEILDAIEAWEDLKAEEAAAAAAAKEEEEAAAAAEALAIQQSIAASLEYQNIMNY